MSTEGYQRIWYWGVSSGVGLLIGSVVDSSLGADRREALHLWAAGATLIVVSGVFHILTRRRWDHGN